MAREGDLASFPDRILLATDGSGDAGLAARAAVDLATRGGADLHVVHVWQDIHTTRFHGYVKRELHRWGQEVLDGQVSEIEASGATVAGAHLKMGHPVEETAQLAAEVDAGLIVVGSRGLRPVQRLLLGSVSEGLARHAQRPVLVVRGTWPPSRVVVGDDSSGDASGAGDLAAAVARLLGAEVTLVRAYPRLPGPIEEEVAAKDGGGDGQQREADDGLEERAGELAEVLGSQPRVERLAGDAAASILETAGGSALVAVGSRGLGSLERAGLGSVSTKVLRAAEGPVLVAPLPSESDLPVGSARPTFLVATDGSECSLHAGERAVLLSGLVGAKLLVLYVVEVERAYQSGSYHGGPPEELARAGREATGKIATLAAEGGVECEEIIVEGRPAQVILEKAREKRADYVLMGVEGMSRPARALLGSTSQEVLRHADRPVLLVGGRKRPDDPLLSGRVRLAQQATTTQEGTPQKDGG